LHDVPHRLHGQNRVHPTRALAFRAPRPAGSSRSRCCSGSIREAGPGDRGTHRPWSRRSFRALQLEPPRVVSAALLTVRRPRRSLHPRTAVAYEWETLRRWRRASARWMRGIAEGSLSTSTSLLGLQCFWCISFMILKHVRRLTATIVFPFIYTIA
jgi:hypothetical protein